MGITRKEMKLTAKAGMRNARPSPMLITLVYILLTTGISLIIPCILVPLFGLHNILYLLGKEFSTYDIVYYYLGTTGILAYLFVNVLTGLFSMVVTFGYMGYNLRVSRSEDARFGNLLDGFGLAGRVIVLNILTDVFITLWSMLFIIPGIIAAYRYRMALFILLDDPECGALEAIRMSKTMMKGRKANLFVFDLSFLNWILPYLAAAAAGGAVITLGMLGDAANYVALFLGMAIIYILWAILSLWVAPFFLTSQAVYYDAISDDDTWPRHSRGSSGPEVRF